MAGLTRSSGNTSTNTTPSVAPAQIITEAETTIKKEIYRTTYAVHCCKYMAEKGYIHAQFFMSRAYEYGIGVKKDAEQAEAWYAKAAAQLHIATLQKKSNTLRGVYLAKRHKEKNPLEMTIARGIGRQQKTAAAAVVAAATSTTPSMRAR
jgi:TPR repeat protein